LLLSVSGDSIAPGNIGNWRTCRRQSQHDVNNYHGKRIGQSHKHPY